MMNAHQVPIAAGRSVKYSARKLTDVSCKKLPFAAPVTLKFHIGKKCGLTHQSTGSCRKPRRPVISNFRCSF